MAYARSRTRVLPETIPSNMGSGKRDARRGDNASHAQDFLVFHLGDLRDKQTHIFQELEFFQSRIGAHLGKRNLPGQAVKRAQVSDEVFSLVVVRIGVGIARYVRDGIQGALRRGVIAEDAVTFSDPFQSTDRVGFRLGSVPHFLAFNEKRVPVVVVRVGAEYPIVTLRSRSCHRGLESAAIYTGRVKKRNKM